MNDTLYGKRDLAGVIKDLAIGDNPGLPGRPNIITVSFKRVAGEVSKEGNVMTEAKIGVTL